MWEKAPSLSSKASSVNLKIPESTSLKSSQKRHPATETKAEKTAQKTSKTSEPKSAGGKAVKASKKKKKSTSVVRIEVPEKEETVGELDDSSRATLVEVSIM